MDDPFRPLGGEDTHEDAAQQVYISHENQVNTKVYRRVFEGPAAYQTWFLVPRLTLTVAHSKEILENRTYVNMSEATHFMYPEKVLCSTSFLQPHHYIHIYFITVYTEK